MKRFFDTLLAGIVLVLGSPFLAAIGVAVRLDSKGPVIFRQQRVGRGGVPFELLKFRTMADLPAGGATGPSVTASGDRRITRIGRALRSTKLDELPQLVNVLRGEMSLVGPRPEVAEYVALWPEDQRGLILSVRPGITDPASIVFRREEELLAEQDDPETYYVEVVLPQKASLYAAYAESRSFVGDLRLIWATLRSVATG